MSKLNGLGRTHQEHTFVLKLKSKLRLLFHYVRGVVDDLFGVVHIAVTDFDGVAVKYLAEAVILREMFVD